MKWTEEEILKFKSEYPNFGSKSPSFGHRTRWAILAKAKELKLKISKELRFKNASDAGSSNCIYTIYHQKLNEINDAKVAYVLGFLWADGSLRENKYFGISFQNKKDDVLDIKEELLTFGNWKLRVVNEKYIRGNISGKIGYQILLNWDYRDKSHLSADKVLQAIPNNLKHFWWRGYLDGDGSIGNYNYKNSVTFTSSRDQDWSFFFKSFPMIKSGLYFSKYKTKNNKIHQHSQIKIQEKKSIIELLNYIYMGYDTDKIGFARKAEQARNLIHKIR